MPGTPIKSSVLNALQRQLNHELEAAHAYQALSIWCDEQNLRGFKSFFEKQATEERLHAQKFIDHLLDRALICVPAARSVP